MSHYVQKYTKNDIAGSKPYCKNYVIEQPVAEPSRNFRNASESFGSHYPSWARSLIYMAAAGGFPGIPVRNSSKERGVRFRDNMGGGTFVPTPSPQSKAFGWDSSQCRVNQTETRLRSGQISSNILINIFYIKADVNSVNDCACLPSSTWCWTSMFNLSSSLKQNPAESRWSLAFRSVNTALMVRYRHLICLTNHLKLFEQGASEENCTPTNK